MERDPKVFILGEEVGIWGGTYAVTKGFYDHFGEKRVKDTPIAEAAIIGAAIGSALAGLRPVAELMTINFAFSAMDHIVNQAAKLHYMFSGQFCHLVIRLSAGGRQLATTHSQTPGMIFAPPWPQLVSRTPKTPRFASTRPLQRPGALHRACHVPGAWRSSDGDFTIDWKSSTTPGKDASGGVFQGESLNR
jgi:pyruvate dehydrogenase E1 component beta subunit